MRHGSAWLCILAAAILVTLVSCDKGTEPKQRFSGITERTEWGEIVSEDADDWCPGPPLYTYSFGPAFPNPAWTITVIQYSVLQQCDVSLSIVNERLDGIRTLVHQVRQAGLYRVVWDLRDTEGDRVSAGIYRAAIGAADFECYGDIEVKDFPGISDECKRFADEHWMGDRYRIWREAYCDTTRGWPDYRLPQARNDEYYFIIGKYDQFVLGWDDTWEYDPSQYSSPESLREVRSENRLTYVAMFLP